jgi:hypothetical protein
MMVIADKSINFEFSPDAKEFLGHFVDRSSCEDEVNSQRLDILSLGTVALHGSSPKKGIGRDPRLTFRTLLAPEGSYDMTRALFAPETSAAQFQSILDAYAARNAREAGRYVTIDELFDIGKTLVDLPMSQRFAARKALLAEVAKTPIGGFSLRRLRDGPLGLGQPAVSSHTMPVQWIDKPQTLVNRSNWREHGECVENPEVFFDQKPAMINFAKSLCAQCVSLPFCREDVIETRALDEGVQAGMTKSERRQLLSGKKTR